MRHAGHRAQPAQRAERAREPRPVARRPRHRHLGALAAVVEFQDTFDGGAIGNVNIKLLPSDKSLLTSSVPLLWNDTIADPSARSDANWLASLARPGGQLSTLQSYADSTANTSGCGDWTTTAGEGGTYAAAAAGPGYKALFHELR